MFCLGMCDEKDALKVDSWSLPSRMAGSANVQGDDHLRQRAEHVRQSDLGSADFSITLVLMAVNERVTASTPHLGDLFNIDLVSPRSRHV